MGKGGNRELEGLKREERLTIITEPSVMMSSFKEICTVYMILIQPAAYLEHV
jgi:hypothetical protein